MPKHFDHLLFYIPELPRQKILDVGSGRGKFLVQAAQAGSEAVGLEKNPEYIELSKKLAQENQVNIEVVPGLAEDLPFTDNDFDFINLSEVIEHVENPHKVLAELFRVLKPSGKIYISVPNRYSFYDTHYHLYLVNWLPRSYSEFYIRFFNKAKDYSHVAAGRQKLSEMHYYTFAQFKKLVNSIGFSIQDMRLIKIRQKIKNPLLYSIVSFIYRLLRPFYFRTFHILLSK